MRKTSSARPFHHGFAWRAIATTARIMTRDGRYHEADRALDLGARCVAGNLKGFAGGSNAPELAARAWEAAVGALPDRPICRSRLTSSLRRGGNLARAGDVIEEASRLFPDDLGILIEAARVADQRDDFARALGYWRRVEAKTTLRPLWSTGVAHALVMLGRFDEAETLLAKERTKHPRHRGLMAIECMLASSREDWPRAVSLARAFRLRFPKHPDGWRIEGHAVEGAKLAAMTARRRPTALVNAPADVGRAKDDEACRLLLGFISLGENCEFGLVQRRYGAEPLDLLRWNIVYVGDLVDALDQDLKGLGEPENTELTVLSNGEYFVHDRRWYLGMHTFLREGQAARDDLYEAVCLRIEALKAGFFDELASARRIFVYSAPDLDGDAIAMIHRALRRFGPNRLLVVQPAEPTVPSGFRGRPGDVRVVEPGLYVGFVRHLGINAGGRWDIAFDDWVLMCRKAAVAAAAEAQALAANATLAVTPGDPVGG